MTPQNHGARSLDQDENTTFDMLVVGDGAHRPLWRLLVNGLLLTIFYALCSVVMIVCTIILLTGLLWALLMIFTEVLDKWPR